MTTNCQATNYSTMSNDAKTAEGMKGSYLFNVRAISIDNLFPLVIPLFKLIFILSPPLLANVMVLPIIDSRIVIFFISWCD